MSIVTKRNALTKEGKSRSASTYESSTASDPRHIQTESSKRARISPDVEQSVPTQGSSSSPTHQEKHPVIRRWLKMGPLITKFTESQRGLAHSPYATVSQAQVMTWMQSPLPKSRDEAIKKFMRYDEEVGWTEPQVVFHRLVPLTAKQIPLIYRAPQKSDDWFKGRLPRKTGSKGGAIIGWAYNDPLKDIHESIFKDFPESAATKHGVDTEQESCQAYLVELTKEINTQYLLQESYRTGKMMFRGTEIRLARASDKALFKAPRARMWHLGMVTDPYNEFQGVSMDGLVTLEGDIVYGLIVVEAKCPFDQYKYALYPNEPMYYFTQPADNHYTLLRLLKTIRSSDRVTYSPKHGIRIDTQALDANWYLNWYSPRVLRHYFGTSTMLGYIQNLSISMVCRFRAQCPDEEFNVDTFSMYLKTLTLSDALTN